MVCGKLSEIVMMHYTLLQFIYKHCHPFGMDIWNAKICCVVKTEEHVMCH